MELETRFRGLFSTNYMQKVNLAKKKIDGKILLLLLLLVRRWWFWITNKKDEVKVEIFFIKNIKIHLVGNWNSRYYSEFYDENVKMEYLFVRIANSSWLLELKKNYESNHGWITELPCMHAENMCCWLVVAPAAALRCNWLVKQPFPVLFFPPLAGVGDENNKSIKF